MRSIGFAVVIITFISAGAIEVFENDVSQFPEYVPLARLDGLTFLDCQYFVMVTLATIGCVFWASCCLRSAADPGVLCRRLHTHDRAEWLFV